MLCCATLTAKRIGTWTQTDIEVMPGELEQQLTCAIRQRTPGPCVEACDICDGCVVG